MEATKDSQPEFVYCQSVIAACRAEIQKRLIGQDGLIDGMLAACIAGGHVLLEGVPGLAKTLAAQTFAQSAGLSVSRIQFTPDLLPADVTGTLIYEQGRGTFTVRKGPLFAHIVLADEINRAPAKVQSAMLEAMAERQVTIGDDTYQLPDPFFVVATQNPIEQDGTYNLPEAELDRFLLKIVLTYPSTAAERAIVKTMGTASTVPVTSVLTEADIRRCRHLVRQVVCDDAIIDYIVSIIGVTRPEDTAPQSTHDITRYITFGASPRAGIALLLCAKARALMAGRGYVLPEDVKAMAAPVLRHRLVLSYEAAADAVSADYIIEKILAVIPVP